MKRNSGSRRASGSESSGQMVKKQKTASKKLLQLAGANNAFALHLYQTLQDEQKGQNLFFSPLSISTALAMTHLGARGDTATQIADVFRFNQMKQGQLHSVFKELNTLLYQADPGYKLKAANKLYGKSGYDFVQTFLEGTASYYGTAMGTVDDFASASAAKSINDWVKKQTEGKIKDLIGPGVLNALTRLVLVNAIYFNGTWSSTFDATNNVQDSFKVLDSRKVVPVSLMIQEGIFPLAIDKTNDCRVLEMPYQGDNLSLLIALPVKDDGLGQLESKLSADILKSWDKGLKLKQVNIMLPKFKLEANFQLMKVLELMGMPDAFDGRKANFEGISGDRKFALSAVIHKAFIDVNEEGTEAAAATGVVATLACYQTPILFRADHPFLFMIRHRSTKSVLFIGRMVDPS